MSVMNSRTSGSKPQARYPFSTCSRSRAPVWWVTRIRSRRSARWGSASTTRMLRAWAPCEPPNTSSRGRSWLTSGRMKFSISVRRMGFPSW